MRRGTGTATGNRHRKEARVRVTCPDGLSPADEFYLWGLLSLTFSQPQPTADFYATPYYCLRRLGSIDASANRGGKNYDLFRSAISRLSTVTYRNDHFYDPIRGEHRDVGFGFLSYSLPLDPGSSRAWRFAWDPIFFEFCSALRGCALVRFPHLPPPRRSQPPPVSPAQKNLLAERTYRRRSSCATSPCIPSASPPLTRPTNSSASCGPVCSDSPKKASSACLSGPRASGIFAVKAGKGRYVVQFHRGPHFEGATPDSPALDPAESALYEPLATIGFEPAAIRRILAAYDPRLVAECADMTLAARERFGAHFFKKSPQAYFTDNIQKQSRRERTPPDWWRALRAEEERRRRESAGDDEPAGRPLRRRGSAQYLETEARETFEQVMSSVFRDFKAAGQSDPAAKENARRQAEIHLRNRFFKEHPECREGGPTRLADRPAAAEYRPSRPNFRPRIRTVPS